MLAVPPASALAAEQKALGMPQDPPDHLMGGAPMSPAVITRRCDPYGAESGGPKRLLGGVYGPEYVGPHMWNCERLADARYRMICRCGHRGQPMWLRGPGLVNDEQGIPYFHPGHVAEFSKRSSDLCPVCVFPPEARQWSE